MIANCMIKQGKLLFSVVMFVCLFCLCLFAETLHASTKLTIQMGGLKSYSCGLEYHSSIVTGSVGTIMVSVTPIGNDLEFVGFPSEAPEWLAIQFSYAETKQVSFIESAELYDLLNPTFFLRAEQIEYNRKKDLGESQSSLIPLWSYFFSYQIPEFLSGRRICARAVVSVPPYGPLREVQGPLFENLECKHFISPCSDDDRQNALGTYIWLESIKGADSRVLELTDSLISTGWSSGKGLLIARTSANKLEDYKSALRYLEVMYDRFGYVTPPLRSDSPPFSPMQINPASESEAYRIQRTNLERAIAEQEEQQR